MKHLAVIMFIEHVKWQNVVIRGLSFLCSILLFYIWLVWQDFIVNR